MYFYSLSCIELYNVRLQMYNLWDMLVQPCMIYMYYMNVLASELGMPLALVVRLISLVGEEILVC